MIEFKCNESDISKAVFVGDADTILAELLLEINVLYGSIYQHDKKYAEQFKQSLIYTILDEEGQKTIFSDDVVKVIEQRKNFATTSCVIDKEGFAKQVMELMKDEGE